MWQWLLNLLAGPLLGTISKWHDTGVSADVSVITARTLAEVELAKLQAQLVIADKGWWATAWMKPCIVYPCALHFGAIMLDSTFRFGWGVPRPPAPYAEWEGAILLGAVGVMGLKSVARIFSR